MKTSFVVGIVIAAHCLVVGMIMLIQGCGTTPLVTSAPPPPVMPPMEAPAVAPPMARVPVAKPPVRQWPSETTTYVIQKGEALSVIAKRFDVSMAEIMALNRISDPDKIWAGQKLVLPGKVDVSAAAPVVKRTPTAKPRVAVSGDKYVVKAGDSLSVIAARYGTRVNALREANGLTSDRILVGQELIIPGGKKPEPVAKPKETVSEMPVPVVDLDPEPERDETEDDIASTEVIPEPSVEDDSGMRTHVVEEGEDLYSVSLMWDVSITELQRVNRLSGTDLTPGTVLKIPLTE